MSEAQERRRQDDPSTLDASTATGGPEHAPRTDAAARLGSGLLQRKLSRRIQRDKDKNKGDKDVTAAGGAGPDGGAKDATAGPSEEDLKKEFDSMPFKRAFEHGFTTYKEVRGVFLSMFGSIDGAKKFYGSVSDHTFLGHSTSMHQKLADHLADASKLLDTPAKKDWKDIATKNITKMGGWNIRLNRDDKSQLSNHSFGTAVDINDAHNPNVHDLPSKVVKGLTGEGLYSGAADAKMIVGGTADQMLPLAQEMAKSSQDFQAALKDEASFKAALKGYLTGKLDLTVDDKDIDLVQLRAAAAKGGGKELQKVVDKLLAAEDPFLWGVLAAASEQHDEEREEYVQKHGWKKWIAHKKEQDATAKKAADKQEAVDKKKPLTEIDVAVRLGAAFQALKEDVARKGASFLVDAVKVFDQSFADKAHTKRTAATTEGTGGSIAANGFIDLKAELIAALTGSDGGHLTWLGNSGGNKDFMHFELKSGDQPAKK